MTTHSALFRHEALDFQRLQRWWGEVALLQAPSTKLLSWSAVAAFAVMLAFACFAPYAREETVPSYLTPTAGAAKIFVTTPGVVTEVYVREGDQVQGGQPLLTIGTDQIAADGQDVNAAILTALAPQRGLLRQQIAAEKQRREAERDRLSARIRSQASEVAQIEAQIAAQGERIRLAESVESSAAKLITKDERQHYDVQYRFEQRPTISELRVR